MAFKRKYAWGEIKRFLIKELKKTKDIMTYGTIGSLDLDHDIDTIITKKPDSPSNKFYEEVHTLFDSLNSYLKRRYNKKLIRFSAFIHEEEVLKIGGYKKGDLVFHVMTYISLPQMETHWNPNLIKGDSIKKIILKYYKPLIGKTKLIFNKRFSKSNKYEGLFLYLNDVDRINSNYPKEFLVKVMNHLFRYILKRVKINKTLIAKNEVEVRKYFYELCKILNRLK